MSVCKTATAFGGLLFRGEDGWYWIDGTPEPRVEDTGIRSPTDHYRVVERSGRAYVEIPSDYRAQVLPDDTAMTTAVDAMIADYGHRAEVHADRLARLAGLEDLTVTGWIVPLEIWQRQLQHPQAASWDMADDSDLRAYARSLGYVEFTPPGYPE